jgi:hypothetical protein
LLAGKEIVDPSKEAVAAEFPRITAAIVTYGFGQVEAMFAVLTRQEVGASDAVEDFGDLY